MNGTENGICHDCIQLNIFQHMVCFDIQEKKIFCISRGGEKRCSWEKEVKKNDLAIHCQDVES